MRDSGHTMQKNGSSLDSLPVNMLEEVLTDLMIVKYPGIERLDIDRLLGALSMGDLDLVSQVEADIAVKSAQWKSALLDMDTGYVEGQAGAL